MGSTARKWDYMVNMELLKRAFAVRADMVLATCNFIPVVFKIRQFDFETPFALFKR